VASDGYLRGVLADGARPFRYRTGVCELLGQPPDAGVRVRFAAAMPRAGFTYLRRYGDGSADVPVGVQRWLGLVADDLTEPSAPAAPARTRSAPPGPAPAADQSLADPPGQPRGLAESRPTGPAPDVTIVIPGTTTRPDRSGPAPGHGDPLRPGSSGVAEPGTPPGGWSPGRAGGAVRPGASAEPASRPPVATVVAVGGLDDRGGPGTAPDSWPDDRPRLDPPAGPPSPVRTAGSATAVPAPSSTIVTTAAPAPVPVATSRPVPDLAVARPVTTIQPRRMPGTAASTPAGTPWSPPAAPAGEPTATLPVAAPVTGWPYRRAAPPRPAVPPPDHIEAEPPPPAAPPVVVVPAPEPVPGPAGTPLFWERRYLTRLRARILR
jgi:hypothetical protein